MRALGLRGATAGDHKRPRTTIPGKDTRPEDALNRDFTAGAPNRTWVMDFTYVRTWAGFVYTAFIVDVFAQKIVAWHCATSKETELVMTPFRMATWLGWMHAAPMKPRRRERRMTARSRAAIGR